MLPELEKILDAKHAFTWRHALTPDTVLIPVDIYYAIRSVKQPVSYVEYIPATGVTKMFGMCVILVDKGIPMQVCFTGD